MQLDLLYYLIGARLCISVTQSAYHSATETNNEHHFLTEVPAWDLLYKLIKINPIKAKDMFKKACGFEAAINDADHSELLTRRKKHSP